MAIVVVGRVKASKCSGSLEKLRKEMPFDLEFFKKKNYSRDVYRTL